VRFRPAPSAAKIRCQFEVIGSDTDVLSRRGEPT
jgi:hypothetical protein